MHEKIIIISATVYRSAIRHRIGLPPSAGMLGTKCHLCDQVIDSPDHYQCCNGTKGAVVDRHNLIEKEFSIASTNVANGIVHRQPNMSRLTHHRRTYVGSHASHTRTVALRISLAPIVVTVVRC